MEWDLGPCATEAIRVPSLAMKLFASSRIVLLVTMLCLVLAGVFALLDIGWWVDAALIAARAWSKTTASRAKRPSAGAVSRP